MVNVKCWHSRERLGETQDVLGRGGVTCVEGVGDVSFIVVAAGQGQVVVRSVGAEATQGLVFAAVRVRPSAILTHNQ
jgi:hypothetical protein